MKKALVVLFLFGVVFVRAQDNSNKRSAIFFEDQAKFPKELDGVKDWLIGFTSQWPYVFRNAQSSQKNDATFQQFSLALGLKKTFPIGNSGCAFTIFSADEKPSHGNVQYEGKWKISAYQPGFDLHAFVPSDNYTIFATSLLIYNISEQQAMAEFINDLPNGKVASPIRQYVSDIEKSTGKKLAVADIDKTNLTDLAKIIYAKTGRYASDVSYQKYIKDKNHDKETAKLRNFFRRYASDNVVDDFLGRITPEGRFYFEKLGVTIELPKGLFNFPEGKASPLSFNFKYLSHKIEYDKTQTPYMRFTFDKVSVSGENIPFEIINEYELNKKIFILGFGKHQVFQSNAVSQIKLELYKDRLKICMTVKGEDDLEREYFISGQKISLQ